MAIKSMILHNWKSYEGTVVIPLYNFTAIIGPNGAGKSNLMDALSFVLGLSSSKLRSKKMKNSIHRKENSSGKFDNAYVEIVYEDKESSETSLTSFKRSIRYSGVTVYTLNDKNVSFEDYSAKLREIGVLTRSKNFMVFQGDIESVASRSSKSLTALIEDVSGSSELVSEYDKRLSEKNAAESELSQYFEKRKNVLKEKRQILEQKNEAENYQKLLQQLKKEKRKLCCAEYREYEREKKKLPKREEKETALESVKQKQNEFETKMLKEVSDKTAYEKDITSLSGDMASEIDLNETFKSDKSALLEKLSIKENCVDKDIKSLDRLKKMQDDKNEKIKVLEIEFLKTKEKISELENKPSENEKEIYTNEKVIEEYKAIRIECDAKTKLQQMDIALLDEKISNISEMEMSLEEQVEILGQKTYRINESKSACEDALKELREEMGKREEEFQKLRSTEDLKKVEKSKKEKKMTEIEEEIRKNEEILSDLTIDKQTSERDRKRIDNFNALKDAFPDSVLGFVVDLVRPIHRRFQNAVMAALGLFNMDAIVVDSSKSALDCISFLKERQLGAATFFPIDSIRPKPLKTELRNLDREAKLIIDLVSFEKEHYPLALFVFGSTVYCDSLDKAREICYGRKGSGDRIKAVTKDGVVISKNGNITGGKSDFVKNSSNRFNERVIFDLEKRQKKLKKKLKSLDVVEDLNNDDDNENISSIEKRIEWIKVEIEENLKTIESYISKLKAADETREKASLDLKANRDLKASLSKEKEEKEKEYLKIKSQIFSEFCEKYKMENIFEFEQTIEGGSFAKNSKEKMRLLTQLNRIKEKINFLRSKDYSAEITESEETVSKQTDQIKTIKLEIEEIENRISESLNNINKKKEAINEKKKRIKSQTKIIKKIEEQMTVIAREKEKLTEEVAERKRLEEKLELRRKDIIVRAEMEDLDVDRMKNKKVSLKECKNAIEKIEKEISKICPNLKSFEHFKRIEETALEINKKFHDMKEECQLKVKAFNDIEQKRAELFKKAFDHIEAEIGNVYKKLTASKKYPLGGNAYLTLEDSHYQPFLHGTTFSAMPPSKRFREIESLSGGEKSVAALALLFAIQSYKPAPFFILDEIDAALDSSNVERVSSFICEKTKQGLQCIVISLKESFYFLADILVGVYRDRERESSGVLTLEMSKFATRQSRDQSKEDSVLMGSAISKKGRSEKISVSSFDTENE